MEKLSFITKEYIPLLKDLNPGAQGKWGRMNGQQMVEHVCDFFKVSTDKIHFPLTTPAEHLPKYKEFLMSEKQFRENTKAPVLPEEPLPLRNPDMQTALKELEKEINAFVEFFAPNKEKKTLHPAFGDLNFEEWVQLHHKHVTHHLRQFNLM